MPVQDIDPNGRFYEEQKQILNNKTSYEINKFIFKVTKKTKFATKKKKDKRKQNFDTLNKIDKEIRKFRSKTIHVN